MLDRRYEVPRSHARVAESVKEFYRRREDLMRSLHSDHNLEEKEKGSVRTDGHHPFLPAYMEWKEGVIRIKKPKTDSE
jgi:hypothetical protein